MHAAGGNADGEAAATGTYFGCMYTEYLDAILGPSVSVLNSLTSFHSMVKIRVSVLRGFMSQFGLVFRA